MNEEKKQQYVPVYATPLFAEQVNRVKFLFNMDTAQAVEVVFNSLMFDLTMERIAEMARLRLSIENTFTSSNN